MLTCEDTGCASNHCHSNTLDTMNCTQTNKTTYKSKMSLARPAVSHWDQFWWQYFSMCCSNNTKFPASLWELTWLCQPKLAKLQECRMQCCTGHEATESSRPLRLSSQFYHSRQFYSSLTPLWGSVCSQLSVRCRKGSAWSAWFSSESTGTGAPPSPRPKFNPRPAFCATDAWSGQEFELPRKRWIRCCFWGLGWEKPFVDVREPGYCDTPRDKVLRFRDESNSEGWLFVTSPLLHTGWFTWFFCDANFPDFRKVDGNAGLTLLSKKNENAQRRMKLHVSLSHSPSSGSFLQVEHLEGDADALVGRTHEVVDAVRLTRVRVWVVGRLERSLGTIIRVVVVNAVVIGFHWKSWKKLNAFLWVWDKKTLGLFRFSFQHVPNAFLVFSRGSATHIVSMCLSVTVWLLRGTPPLPEHYFCSGQGTCADKQKV